MNKLKALFSIVTAFVVALVALTLTSCSSSSGLKASDVSMRPSVTASTVTLTITISNNDNIKSGAAVPYVYEYVYDSDSDEYVASTNKKKEVTFSNNVYTSATLKFEGLEAATEYRYVFKVTYNSFEEEITSIDVTTKANSTEGDSSEILTAQDFLSIYDDSKGSFVLGADIDFEAEGVSLSGVTKFSESNPFEGTFNGNGHVIKNFTLDASTYMGLFNYCNGATIKDLSIENATIDLATGRSTTYAGAIAGKALNSTISNVTVNGVDILIAGNSSANLYLGGAFGIVDTCAVSNVNLDSVEIEVTQCRLNVYMGLFAGQIAGGLYNDNEYMIKDSSAIGSLISTLYYTSTSKSTIGSLFLGGFAGDISSNGLITDSFADSNITIYKSNSSNGYVNIQIGGFVGAMQNGNVTKCAAITQMDINAGVIDDPEAENDFSDVKLALDDYKVYIGGFIGLATDPYAQLTNSYALFKNENKFNAKENSKTIIDNFAASNCYSDGDERFNNCANTNDKTTYDDVFGYDSSIYQYLLENQYFE